MFEKLVSFLPARLRPLARRFSTFGIIGIAVMIGGVFFLHALVVLGVEERIANIIQAVTSVSLSFILNYRFTFYDRRGMPARVQIIRYLIFKGLTLILNDFLFVTFTQVFGIHYSVTYFLNVAIIMGVNFVGYAVYVFSSRDYLKTIRLFFWRLFNGNSPD